MLEYRWWFQVDSKGTQPYIHMYPFSPKLPSHPGCHMTLSRIPRAIQWVLSWLSILNIAAHSFFLSMPPISLQYDQISSPLSSSCSSSHEHLFLSSHSIGEGDVPRSLHLLVQGGHLARHLKHKILVATHRISLFWRLVFRAITDGWHQLQLHLNIHTDAGIDTNLKLTRALPL